MDNIYLIQQAIDYVEANLKNKLTLEDIADRANYSPWHFHRLFCVVTGFSLGEYIRKRRMSQASRELVFSDRPIKQLAADYQFESQEAFTRSFKKYCGITPGKVRHDDSPILMFGAITLIPKRGETMLKPVLKSMDAFQVIGMMCITTMKTNSIPKLWGEFNHRKDEIPNATDFDGYLGICFGDSEGEMTEDTPFNYMASAIVSSFDSIPEGMVTKSIPAAEYYVFEHHGALDTLDKTYNEIYQNWSSSNDYKPVGDYDFELYDARFKFGEPDSIMEIWIPVQKR